MADFGTHGGHGGAFYGILVRFLAMFLGWGPLIVALAYVYGFLEGAWPDISGAIKAALHPSWGKAEGVDRWPFIFGLTVRVHVPTYHWYHMEYRGHWWEWLPGLRLHVKHVDPPFHAAGSNWFPREWPRYLIMIAIALAGVFLTFF